MENLNHSESMKCVSCEKWMKLAELPTHIAREHVGYFPYRCLAEGCGLKATTDDFGLLLLHRIETKHQYAVKVRPEMERLIADTLRICVEEAGKGWRGVKLEPGVKEQHVVIEILDGDETEESSIPAGAPLPPKPQATPLISAWQRGRTEDLMGHFDTVPSPGGPRSMAKQAAMPTPRPSDTPSAISESKGVKKAAVEGGGATKPRRATTRRKKEAVAVSTPREMPNPPNTPQRPSMEQSADDGLTQRLSPSPARKELDRSSTPTQPPAQPSLSTSGVGQKRNASDANSHEEAGEGCAKRRKPEPAAPTDGPVALLPVEVPATNKDGPSGQGGGLKALFSRVRQPTSARQPIYSAYQLWMGENFGRMFAEGDGSVSNGQMEVISQWARLKDKSKWERMAEEQSAARRKKVDS